MEWRTRSRSWKGVAAGVTGGLPEEVTFKLRSEGWEEICQMDKGWGKKSKWHVKDPEERESWAYLSALARSGVWSV